MFLATPRSRRHTIRTLTVLAAFLLPVTPFLNRTLAVAEPPRAASKLTLTILHDNDLHGHIFPFAYTETGRTKEEAPSVGGAARRATLVRRLRGQIKNPVFLVDCGDAFTRGPLTNAYEGIADIESMNAVGYELAAIGNNEFKAKDGVEQNDAAGAESALLRVIKRSRFPWVCANARDEKGAFLEGVQPYVVRTFNGVRVGFLGLTAPRSAGYPQTKGWTISDPIAAAKEWIPRARAECDVLIAVTHIGVDLDKRLAAETTGIDAIVGGDSHTYLYQAVDVKNADSSATVPIVQDGEFGVNMGRFDLHLIRDGSTPKWHLKDYFYELLPVDNKIREAKDVAAVLAPYRSPLDTVVGHLSSIAMTPELRDKQTTQVVVDALRKETGADLAMNPQAGGFFGTFHHRDVTRYDVFEVMPFKNNVVIASLTGAEIQALLKAHSDIISGDTANLDRAKTYRIAMVDFIAVSEYKIGADHLELTDRDLREVVIAYMGHL